MILLNACGLESAVLLHEYRDAEALYVNEGLTFSNRQEAWWRKLCAEMGVEFLRVKYRSDALSSLKLADDRWFLGYSPAAVARYLGYSPVPEGGEPGVEVSDDYEMWYVPQRYGLLVGFAMQAAEARKTHLRLATCRRALQSVDNTPEAVAGLVERFSACSDLPPAVEMPYRGLTYGQVVARGKKSGAPLKKVWTCLNDLARLCGVCAACLERQLVVKTLTGQTDGDGATYDLLNRTGGRPLQRGD